MIPFKPKTRVYIVVVKNNIFINVLLKFFIKFRFMYYRVVYKYIEIWRVFVLVCLMSYDQGFCFVKIICVNIFNLLLRQKKHDDV